MDETTPLSAAGIEALSGRAAGILTVEKEKDRARTNGASHHFNTPGYEKRLSHDAPDNRPALFAYVDLQSVRANGD